MLHTQLIEIVSNSIASHRWKYCSTISKNCQTFSGLELGFIDLPGQFWIAIHSYHPQPLYSFQVANSSPLNVIGKKQFFTALMGQASPKFAKQKQ